MDKEKEQKNNKEEQEKPLTPWQKEHQEFIAEKKQVVNEEKQVLNEDLQKSTESKKEAIKKQDYESFQVRLPKMRKQRNLKLLKQLIVIFSGFILGILLMIYFISPFSKLQKIRVVGNQHLTQTAIIKQAKMKPGTNILLQWLNKRYFGKSIKNSLTRVEDVHVNLTRFNELTITVKEYPEILYEFNERKQRYYPILKNGVCLNDPKKKEDSALPVLKAFNKKNNFNEVIRQVKKLNLSVRALIKTITLTPTEINPELVLIKMKDENEVKISLESIGRKLNDYSKIAYQMNEPGVIDMEIGAFSYPFSKKEEEEKHGKDSDVKKESENVSTEPLDS